MKKYLSVLTATFTSMAFASVSLDAVEGSSPLDSLDAYNVVWESPSQNEHGSMPIGNGDLAANVWVEPNGDLVFYISKSDAWSGNGRLLKLGKVRVQCEPAFIQPGAEFTQTLDLKSGRILVSSTSRTANKTLSFFVDANDPVIHIDIDSDQAFSATASLELWRTERRELQSDIGSARGLMGGPAIFVEADTVLPADGNTVRWYHRNVNSAYTVTLNNQHLGAFVGKYPDPLIHRTFGGLIAADAMVSKDDKTLATARSVKNLQLKVMAHTAQTETPEGWTQALGNLLQKVEKTSVEDAREAHQAYWEEFWSRSWIFASGDEDAEIATRAYVLQRWIQACAGRGEYPVKFNGSLFTVAGADGGADVDADYRRWGGNYWFQNTRLIYWPMLYSGDFDQMKPLWKMYRDALPLLKDRTQKYFKHEGVFFNETMYFWGSTNNHDFGWGNPDLYPVSPYIKYYWDSGNELSMMMLDYYSMNPDATFVEETLLPIADNVVLFYDQHFKRNAEGIVHFSPAASLETWHTAEDPLPIIIGLKTVLTRLLELPENLTSPEQRTRWAQFRSELPPIPVGEEGAKQWIKPARIYSSDTANSENPELYAVFPYRAYAVGKPDLEVALETWKRRLVKRTGCWTQDPIQAAMLGLTNEVKRDVVQNAKGKDPSSRFPAFWQANFDWLPDQDHGSVTMIAFQRMLMQTDGDTIRLLPAWPSEWDVDFKLHAPHNTTVEGRVENGKVIEGKVTPESRRKDIIIMQAQN
jgi:hypothetical protein